MKLTFLLTLIGTLGITMATSYSQQTKLTLSMEDAKIKDLLQEIKDKSDFSFWYNNNELDDEQRITVFAKEQTIDNILDIALRSQNLSYEIHDKFIIIYKPYNQELYKDTNRTYRQQIIIKGKVTDFEGNPLPGVNVVEKGKTNGAVTNLDGQYTIPISSPDATLSFSYVGFLTEEISVNSQSTIDVVLIEDIQALEEVVVIGYGSMKKSDLTGSIGSVSNEKLTIKGTTSPMEALQGQIAGVNINATNGRSGTGFEIQIRGNNSLAGGNPLYVVDGLVTGNIQFLNPQDIERVDVLKDASSTAIYGSRGSNGVVIITTKQAKDLKDQKPIISYDGYYGIRTAARLPKLMDGDTYWEYRQNAYLGAEFYSGNDITQPEYNQDWLDERTSYGPSEVLRNILATKNYTNWYDMMLNNGVQQNHWVSISGKSSNNMSYLFGVGYQDDKGVFTNEGYDRYNFKASINHKISDKWSAGINVNIALSEAEIGEDSNVNVYDAFCLPPVVSTYIPEGYENAGELSLIPGSSYDMSINGQLNPLITINNLRDFTRTLYTIGNIYLQFSPIKNLDLKTTFSPYAEGRKRGTYEGSETTQRALLDPAADLTQADYLTYSWDNQLTYKKSFNDHQFNFMTLYSMSYSRFETSYIAVENLPFESLWHNVGSATDIVEVESSYRKSTMISALGRINYSYKGKYLATASFRTDGSSKLATGHKWASFPSFALAWRASEESFLKNLEMLSNLKLRVSYGYTGNNNIGAYSTLRYASNQTYYDFDGAPANGFTPSNIANASLTWEKTNEFNLGVDLGFFAHRINGSIDVYDKLSTGLLMERKLALETGWESVTANVGSVSNKGIEILLNTVNIAINNLTWETTFSYSKNINAIEELYGGDDDDLGNIWFIGEPVDVNYSYVFDGIWQADETEEAAIYGQKEGQARVKDLDNNGTINSNDRTIIGTPTPSWTGSFTTSLRYKGFDFNASLFTQQGIQVYSQFHRTYTAYDERWRNKLDLNYYMAANNVTEARVSNEYPMPKNSGKYWGNENCGFFKDASFVKVKNISLGYTLDPKQMGKIDIKSLRLYVNVLNPFVFSDYDGFDPEWAGRSRNGGGVSTITYQFGINANF